MAPQFDLTDISLFVKIAEMSSVTQGAQHSFISVPAASVRIKNVEARLGTKLLHRTSQGVSLTPAGEAFMRHGRIVLRQLEHLHEDLREYASGAKGHVQILAGSAVTKEFLPEVLSRFLAAHENIALEMRECLVPEIVRGVSEGTAEIGIVAGDVSAKDLEWLPYRRERLVVVAALGHVLARRKAVGFERTLAFDHVTLSGANDTRVVLNQAAAALGETLKVRIQVGDLESLCRIVETGTAIGILPESAARRHTQTTAIRTIELTDEWAAYDLRICVRELRSLPRFTRDLVDLLIADGSRNIADQHAEPSRWRASA